MAHLIAVRRRDDYKFQRRQLPLKIDDTFTMVIQLGEKYFDCDMRYDDEKIRNMDSFRRHFSLFTNDEIAAALTVEFREVYDLLAQVTPCVGCKRSVERLFDQLVVSQHQALDPLVVKTNGLISVNGKFLYDAHSIYSLFYIHGNKVNSLIESIPKNKKNKRCNMHSLDNHKSRVSSVWLDTWDVMALECKDEVLLIDADSLLDTLVTYLKKHKFCVECKSKVMHAYNILVGDVDCTKDKTYCQALYEGLRCCPDERHVHVPCDTQFIAHLISRAEPELAGSRRERHAKTLDIAQEEVLTCLGLSIYERLYRIGQKLRAEEQTWQLLFYLGIDSIKRSFEVALEKKRGISNLELMCEELMEEEKAEEERKLHKRQRKKKRKEAKQRSIICDVNYYTGDNNTATRQTCKCDKESRSPLTFPKGSRTTPELFYDTDKQGKNGNCSHKRDTHHGCGRGSDAGYSSDSCENCSNPSSNGSDIIYSDCVCLTDGRDDHEYSSCLLDECRDCAKASSLSPPSSSCDPQRSRCQGKPVCVEGCTLRDSPTRDQHRRHRQSHSPHSSRTQPYRLTYSLQEMLEEPCLSDEEGDVISEEDIRRFKANRNVTDERQALRETLRLRFQKLQLRLCTNCHQTMAAEHTCIK